MTFDLHKETTLQEMTQKLLYRYPFVRHVYNDMQNVALSLSNPKWQI